MPLISVIIPVYNGEKTIRQTIEYVLKQSFADWELIVINDGSQDSTLEIVSSIKDLRLKVFSYPNAGLAASRNRGIVKASGEYISFLDADDLWTQDKLESQLKALQENPQAAVAYSWINCIDEFGQFLRRGNHVIFNGDVYAQLLLTDFIENGSNLLIRKQVFDEVGNFDELLNAVEDWDMWLRLAARYHFVCVPSPQIFYRISPNSMSTNVWKLETSCLQVIERAFARAPEELKHLKKISIANLYKYLTFKVLEGLPERKKGIAAIRFLYHAIKNDPSLLGERVSLKVLLKSGIMTLFPHQQAETLLTKFKTISNTTTILGYIQLF
ncbi:MAG: glycosyltransferase [Moorea sp. SIO2B7]|nr:glycosyltransferase [Moorena sp. SIO2B7]